MIQRIGNSQSSSSSSSIVVIPSSLSRDADDAIQEPFHSFLSPEFSPAYPTKIGRKRQRQIESHCNDDGTDRSCDSVAAVLDNLNQKAAAIAFAVGQKQDELFAEDSSESSDDAADDSGEGIPQKTKVVKATSGRSANTGGRDLVRRNQSPACRYELVRIALLRFRELNGNTYVKRGFVVPKESSDWPEETWGIRLDLAVRKIREGTTYADHLDDLRSLGFSFDSCRGGYGFNMLKNGVIKYQEIYGDMNITRSFVIPKDNAQWPEGMWGVHLGSCLRDIKRGKCYADRKEELQTIGYNFLIHGRSASKKYDFNRIKAAFITYKAVYGDLLVPAKFRVPTGEESWPLETWGLKLGTYTQLIRMGKYGEDRKGEMIDLGFMYDNQRAKYGFELVRSALLKYKEIHGNFLVKQKFLVPSEAAWPENTWGIKLGNVLHDIRQGDSYRNRREELEDLGVTFYSHKNPRGRSLSAAVPESAHTPVALDVVPLEIELDPLFGSQSLLRLHGQQKVVSKGDGLVHFTGVQVGQEPGTEGSQRGQNGIIAYPQISSNIGSTDNDYPPVHVFHPRTDLSHDKPRTNSGIGIETKSVSGSSISVGDINQNRSQCQVSSFQEGDTGSSNISHCILSTGSDTCAPSQSQSHNQSQGHNYLSKKDDKGSTDTEDCVVVLV